MADASSDDSFALKLTVGLGVAALLVATAIATFLDNPVVVLITSYAVAWAVAIVLFGDDAFSRAVNVLIVVYAAVIVFVCTLSPLPNSAIEGLPLTDRLNYYYIYYIGTGLAGVQENIETGYLLLVTAAHAMMPFEVFLAILAVGVFATLMMLLRAIGFIQLVGVFALLLLAYFSFWSGALNITRQFVSAGLGFMAVVALVREGSTKQWVRITFYVTLVSASFSVHSSGFIFGIFGVLYALRRYGHRLLTWIWVGNITIFLLNFFNYSPLSVVPGLSDRLARYDSSQISDAGLAAFQSSGVTTGNRIDWAAALLLPMLFHGAVALLNARRPAFRERADALFMLGLVYTSLCIPFYLLSFLAFGDRIAFYSFLVLPGYLLGTLVVGVGKELRYVTLALLAAGCIAQVALGIYGYTPKLWLTGLP
ncbi:hypothetical protein [Sphingomonas sp. 8AM]|uniref:hypothetical protein n=1 Tax=Sphingomonas sp. 8AM TaxID=2653170 RepID=UPI0012F0B89D|nr:hypothetical protein [Sphingomonas sp. 8AM]VXD00967.1 membrane hypothetical protein [Sphingomonas sp. 8AM]